jgi:hypothetical protein
MGVIIRGDRATLRFITGILNRRLSKRLSKPLVIGWSAQFGWLVNDAHNSHRVDQNSVMTVGPIGTKHSWFA